MKKIFILIITITFIFMLSSCTVQDEPGFKVGFHQDQSLKDICLGGSSNVDIHKKGLEKMTLYYGITDDFYEKLKDDRAVCSHFGFDEIFSIVIVMYNDADYDYLQSCVQECEDYYNIENTYILKEISKSELLTRNYNVDYPNNSHITYNLSEEITIPQELLKCEEGEIIIEGFMVLVSHTNNNYGLFRDGYISLGYRKLDNETIRIWETSI